MAQKDSDFLEILKEQGHVYIYRDKSLDDDYLLGGVDIVEREDETLEFRFKGVTSTLMMMESHFKTVFLKTVSRGYLYGVEIEFTLIDDSRFTLKKIISSEKKRLRKFFRVDTEMDFEAKMIDLKGKVANPIKLADSKYVNISGGGFFFYSGELLKKEQKIEFSLDLGDDSVCVIGKVIRCSEVPDRLRMFGTAVEFIKMADQNQDKILNYVSRIQRRFLTKGVFAESRQAC